MPIFFHRRVYVIIYTYAYTHTYVERERERLHYVDFFSIRSIIIGCKWVYASKYCTGISPLKIEVMINRF